VKGRKRPNQESVLERALSVLWRALVSLAITVSGLVIAAIFFGFAEPKLQYAGPKKPLPGTGTVSRDGHLCLVHANILTTLRNWGLKAGHIGKVEIERIGVTPAPEKVQPFCNRSHIWFLQKKDIRCELWTWLDLSKVPPASEVEFRLVFLVPDGREIDRNATFKIKRGPGSR
jgi:hypothetical protein